MWVSMKPSWVLRRGEKWVIWKRSCDTANTVWALLHRRLCSKGYHLLFLAPVSGLTEEETFTSLVFQTESGIVPGDCLSFICLGLLVHRDKWVGSRLQDIPDQNADTQ